MSDQSTYPGRDIIATTLVPLVDLGGLTGKPQVAPSLAPEDPSGITSPVRNMRIRWLPLEICAGGTRVLRANSAQIIPREPREDADGYNRRIFHAVMPPFLNRLATQAAGMILRKGITLTGDPYWEEWADDVTGNGTSLVEFMRRTLVNSILYGHSSILADFTSDDSARSLAEERMSGKRRPYLIPIHPRQILGFRTTTELPQSQLSQVRILETVTVPEGSYGERVRDQVRVMEPGRFELWRKGAATTNQGGWELHASGETTLDCIPVETVYSQREGTLISTPPLLEVSYLAIAYAQRFCDYMYSIHVGASPLLVLRGYDPDSASPVGLSVNTALCLPPEGGGEYIQPTTEAFTAQLQCLQALEAQISRLGINTLSQQNLSNTGVEARALDRIDSDSILANLSADLEGAIERTLAHCAEFLGIPAPEVHISQDFDEKLVDGNAITSYLQLYMQGAICQETLLSILQQGEVLPADVNIEEEVLRTRDMMQDRAITAMGGMDQNLDQAPGAGGEEPADNASDATAASATGTTGTLPTPMRSGRHGA